MEKLELKTSPALHLKKQAWRCKRTLTLGVLGAEHGEPAFWLCSSLVGVLASPRLPTHGGGAYTHSGPNAWTCRLQSLPRGRLRLLELQRLARWRCLVALAQQLSAVGRPAQATALASTVFFGLAWY